MILGIFIKELAKLRRLESHDMICLKEKPVININNFNKLVNLNH
jgi:hypothetical protein